VSPMHGSTPALEATMTTFTIRPARLLAALTVAGVLLVGAHGALASSGSAPTGCRGLSPASAVDCPTAVFAP
jgi:hypothetical protein